MADACNRYEEAMSGIDAHVVPVLHQVSSLGDG
jgi:hypothetical protein